MEAHNAAVEAIAARVRQFHAAQRPFRIFHGSTNSTRPSQRTPDTSIDTSQLKNVLHIDPVARTALVEPNLPMDALLLATLPHGLVPLVVMEFPGITVGGGFSGTSGESSSFRHGFFDNTVAAIEIVLPRGQVLRASRESEPEVFWGAAAAFGTLGVITAVEVRLRPAPKFVRLEYHAFGEMEEAMACMRAQTARKEVEYLDGIVFGRNEIVVCAGTDCDELPVGVKAQDFLRRQDPWFYLHVQRTTRRAAAMHATTPTSKSPPSKDEKENTNRPPPVIVYIPLVSFLFRYDRGAFWVGKYAYSYFLTPFNRVTRYLLDRFMHTRVMYHALHASGQAKIYIIQDVAIPYAGATEFHEWLDAHLTIYPVWLCPLRQRRDDGAKSRYGLYGYLADPDTPEFMMNFGVWGPTKSSARREKFLAENRALEQKVGQLGGRKWLYAHAYYTEEEFWQIYDKKEYDALREKYGAGFLPTVYEKVKVDLSPEAERNMTWLAWLLMILWGVWPLSGLYGVYKAWRGGDYLMQKKSQKLVRTFAAGG